MYICTYFIVLLLLYLQGLQRAYFYTSFAITACRRIFFFYTESNVCQSGNTRAWRHGNDIVVNPRTNRVSVVVSPSRKGQKRFLILANTSSRSRCVSTRIHRFVSVRVYYWTFDNIAVEHNRRRLFGLSNIIIIII